MSRWKSMAVWLVLGMLVACGRNETPDPQTTDAASAQPADAPAVEPPGEAASADSPAAPGAGPAAGADGGVDEADGPFTPIDSLPPTRELQVTVEGMRESREARLFKSPQGYAIYVLPQLEMTPEEPCCDQAYAPVDDGFFMRIERIDPAADLATLRENMVLGLSSVGTARDVASVDFASPDVATDVELAMRAEGEGVSMVMLVARIDGGRYRVTQHLPHREAIEGIAPSFWAMLGSLRTTGPRPVM